MSLARRATIAATGASSQTVVTVLVIQVLLLVSGVLAARALGAEDRGNLAIIWIVPFGVAFLGGMGVPQAATYFVARAGGHPRAVIDLIKRLTVLLIIVLTPVYGLIFLLLIEPSHAGIRTAGLISLASITALVGQSTGLAILQGQQRFNAFNSVRLLPPTLYTTSMVVIYLLDVGSLSLIAGALVGSWLTGSIITWVLVALGRGARGAEPAPGTREVLVFGVRGVIGGVSPVDDLKVDQMLVGFAVGAESLGLYVAAASFANLPKFISQSIGLVAYPRIAAAREFAEAWRLSMRTVAVGAALVVGVVSVLLAVVPFLLPFFYGTEFDDSVVLAEIMLVGTVFLAVRRLASDVSRGLGHPGFGSVGEMASILALAVSVILIGGTSPSAEDVAISVVIASFASALLVSGLLFRVRGGPEARRSSGSME